VVEDRPLGFIHVQDAVAALLLAGERGARPGGGWQVVNAAPEVATVGQVARLVQRVAERRRPGQRVAIEGASASEATFRVRSRLPLQPAHRLDDEASLAEVFDYFVDHNEDQP
jgi:nucleoside-diphosphate-sugar epimerase